MPGCLKAISFEIEEVLTFHAGFRHSAVVVSVHSAFFDSSGIN
jgi:hypothetical protein